LLLDEADKARKGEDEDEENKETQKVLDEVQKILPTKVYTMIQNIARLGQHYLTNQSPVLRRRLLELISTACEGLYRNQDEFLPLVNDVWPVLVKRLYDEEFFVVIAAASAVSEICRRSGDFMSTRIQVEWHNLMKLARQNRSRAEAEKKGRHGRGTYSQNWQLWESSIQLMSAIVQFVRIDDGMFDEVLDLLGDVLDDHEDVREALSVVNGDAVWLKQYSQGRQSDLRAPLLTGYRFVTLDTVFTK
jgi:hypothetical protein